MSRRSNNSQTIEAQALTANGQIDSAAYSAPNVQFDADLAAVIDAWPSVPEAIRMGIIAMINTTKERCDE